MTALLDHTAEIMALFKETFLEELELAGPDGVLRLVRNQSTIACELSNAQTSAETMRVTASAPGVFIDRHPQEHESLVRTGEDVEKDAVIGYLRLGLVLVPITSPLHGHISHINASHADIVGYGDLLMLLEPID